MTKREHLLAMKNNTLREEYEHLVNRKIRRRYSLSEELSLHRKREREPEAFADFEAYVALCKTEAKSEIYREEVNA